MESDYARFAIQLFLQESVQYDVCAAYIHFYPVVLSQQALDELLDVIQVYVAPYAFFIHILTKFMKTIIIYFRVKEMTHSQGNNFKT